MAMMAQHGDMNDELSVIAPQHNSAIDSLSEKLMQAVKEGWMTADGLIKVDHLWFNGKTIHLDGYEFIGCRFDNCELRYQSDKFRLMNCFLGEDTKMVAAKDAAVLPVSRPDDMVARRPHFGHFDLATKADGTIVNVW